MSIRAKLARLFIALAKRCKASNADVFAQLRCPACGTLDGCLCSSPGAPAVTRTPYEEMRRELKDVQTRLADIAGHVAASRYGFGHVDKGDQLVGAVKSICDERDHLRSYLPVESEPAPSPVTRFPPR